MPSRYTIVFVMLTGAFIVVALLAWQSLRWLSAGFLYTAWAFLLVALFYGFSSSKCFLKGSNGRLPGITWLALLPYLCLSYLSFWLYRLATKEPPYAEVAPNVFFGRRLSFSEGLKLRQLGCVGVLDLAVEFGEVRTLRSLPHYFSLPVLDATAPSDGQLRRAVKWMKEKVKNGPVYVHCALGHGRSATVVIAFLMATGELSSVKEGLKRLKSLRSGVRLSDQQFQSLNRFNSDPLRGQNPPMA
jgi:hypothetical protein